MKSILSAFILIGFWGCAADQIKIEEIPLKSNPNEQVEAQRALLKEARAQQLAILSPSWFDRARASFKRAEGIYSLGGNVSSIFENLAMSKAQLVKANEFRTVAVTVVSKALKARNDALTAKATVQTAGYPQAEEGFLALTAAIEKDDLYWAKRDRDRVEGLWRQVELNAIRDHWLGYTRQAINKAESLEAEEYANTTLLQTKGQLLFVDRFIVVNRYKEKEIANLVKSLNFQADRLGVVLAESKRLSESDSEKLALWYESNLNVTAKNLQAGDQRNKPFNSQFDEINSSIKGMKRSFASLKEAHSGLNQRVETLASTSKDAQSSLSVLKSEREFDLAIAKVRQLFGKGEADIYKEQGKMIVRLKNFNFAYGRSSLNKANREVLDKLAGALKDFSGSNVTIEGHTDFVGSKTSNQKLSESRAFNVRRYIQKWHNLNDIQLSSAGKGYALPIASNKTKAGRAMNRRIDIVVSPAHAH